jgi:hypothetical protein
MRIALRDGAYAVCRLGADVASPAPPPGGDGFWSLTHAAGERSLVCREEDAPEGGSVAGGWRVLEVEGPMDLALTGVLASIAGPLAGAGVPVFAVATFDTDWVLVPGAQLAGALDALRAGGHDVVD